MAKNKVKKSDDLLGKAVESGDPMKVALVLSGISSSQTQAISQSLIDSYKKQIDELEKELEMKDEYIHRIKRRVHQFFFGAAEPLYEDDLDWIMDKRK